MNTSAMSPGLWIALGAGAFLVVFLVAFIVVQRQPLERRARFAKLLGHVFLIVVAGSMILGMVAQAFR